MSKLILDLIINKCLHHSNHHDNFTICFQLENKDYSQRPYLYYMALYSRTNTNLKGTTLVGTTAYILL